MTPTVCTVDDRVFLLGLDQLYRDAMKRHERGELLQCARLVSGALGIGPAEVPVEGYYGEDRALTEYFRRMRALQGVSAQSRSPVQQLPQFNRLLEVTSSPLFGEPIFGDRLLPAGRDVLACALRDTFPAWSVQGLVSAAYERAFSGNDFSLVALAACARQAVIIAALRETVVLYAHAPEIARAMAPRKFVHEWHVDAALAERAQRFVATFNALFGEALPQPHAAQAETYWNASAGADIAGRCVRLGSDDSTLPARHYHWAIVAPASGPLQVHEFWSTQVWTTQQMQNLLDTGGSLP